MKIVLVTIGATFLGFILLMWLYIAARLVTRGIIRSIDELKERTNDD
jgi:hypothetical protein